MLAAVAMLVANKKMPNDEVDRIIQALIAQSEQIKQATLSRYTLFPIAVTTGLTIPLHPAAKKYAREQVEPPSWSDTESPRIGAEMNWNSVDRKSVVAQSCGTSASSAFLHSSLMDCA